MKSFKDTRLREMHINIIEVDVKNKKKKGYQPFLNCCRNGLFSNRFATDVKSLAAITDFNASKDDYFG